MFLARVEGQVVATRKDDAINGQKLLIVRLLLVDQQDPTRFKNGQNTIVAIDAMGSGIGDIVLFSQGSSARLAPGMKGCPIDAVIIGIVDSVDVLGKCIFNARDGSPA